MRRHYLNLSNGLEAAPTVLASGEPWALLYLRSTTLERRDWPRLFLEELSDDLLWHLATGTVCVLHDRGTRRPLSKTVYHGVPLIRYVLARHWYGHDPASVPRQGPRGGTVTDVGAEFRAVYGAAVAGRNRDANRVRKRLNYYQRFASPAGVVWFSGASVATEHDGDREFHRQLASVLTVNGG